MYNTSCATYRHVYGDHTKAYKCSSITPFTALWSITQGEQETHDKETNIEVVENDIDDLDTFQFKGRLFQGIRQDTKRDIVVCL